MATAVVIDDTLTIPCCDGLAGFRQWTRSPDFPPTGRIDWIAGSIEVDMSPENLFTHGTLKTEIAAKIYACVRAADLGDVFIDRTRLVCAAADLSVEPDVVFVSHAAIELGRARFVPAASGPAGGFIEIEGAADLVVEILSDSSVGKDTRRLPEAYAAAGVGELWLIDARRCGSGDDQPEFRLLTLQDGRFAAAAEHAGLQVSPGLGGTVRLTKAMTQRGLPRYELVITTVGGR